jgi:hypothetical protein
MALIFTRATVSSVRQYHSAVPAWEIDQQINTILGVDSAEASCAVILVYGT